MLDILDKKRQNLFKKLPGICKLNFYLAGDTALALQLGHRLSVDFDFYTPKEFNIINLVPKIKKIFKNIEIRQKTGKNTFFIEINNIEISFFYYPYKLIKPKIYIQKVALASIPDIAAMKVIAIIQRGTKRDFVDIYYLIKKFSLSKILKWTQKKYPEYNEYLCLRALAYFEDAEKIKSKRKLILKDKDLTWAKIKKYIFKQIKEYHQNLLKK